MAKYLLSIESSRMSGFKCANFHMGGGVLLPGEKGIRQRNQEITMPCFCSLINIIKVCYVLVLRPLLQTLLENEVLAQPMLYLFSLTSHFFRHLDHYCMQAKICDGL